MPLLPAIALATVRASTVSSATGSGGEGEEEEEGEELVVSISVVDAVVIAAVEGFAIVGRGACRLLRCPATSLAAGDTEQRCARIAPR